MQIRKAQKSISKLRIGLSGTSGSGKTYSALLLASGMTEWNKVLIIDTENTSADLYSDLGEYNVLTLEAPYSPERYIQAIKAGEEAGMEVIIIDSVTHEWDGEGGALEINEQIAQSKFRGNTWSAWSQTTPRHRKFINAIVNSKAHIITTARSKQDTIQTEDKKIKKVGLKEIQREGYEYELTLNLNLDVDSHLANASKDRTGMFMGADPFLVTKEVGEKLLEWSNQGVDLKPLIAEIRELVITKGSDEVVLVEYYGADSLEQMSHSSLLDAKAKLESKPDKKKKEEPKKEDPGTDSGTGGANAVSNQETNGGTAGTNEEEEVNVPEDQGEEEDAPDPEPMATAGDIKLFEIAVAKRARQLKKGKDAMIQAFLEKSGKKSMEEFHKAEVNKITDNLMTINREFDEKEEEAKKNAGQSTNEPDIVDTAERIFNSEEPKEEAKPEPEQQSLESQTNENEPKE